MKNRKEAFELKHSEFEDYNVSEDEFLAAIDELAALEMAELEKIVAEAEKSPHQFSEEYLAKKEALIREVEASENSASEEMGIPEKLPFIYRCINSPLKKAAIVAACVGVVALGTDIQTTEAGKNPIVKFFQERYNDHIQIEPHEDLWQNEEKPQTIETVYELGWVPEGYVKEKEDNLGFAFVQAYFNRTVGEKISMEQCCVNTYFSIEEEKEKYEEIKHNGQKYYYLEEGYDKTIVWYQEGYQFIIYANLEKDVILRMAEQIVEIR